MLKKITNITSLLVMATSIVSIVPAVAAEYENVDVKEGTIYNASAQIGGIYIIDGEINGDEDEAIYLLKDGKYTKLDCPKLVGDTFGDTFGNYFELKDSKGNYYIDLTTGKITDDDIRQETIDNYARVLKYKIKNDNDGRFSEDNYTGSNIRKQNDFNHDVAPYRVFTYKLKTPAENGEQNSTIYSNDKGEYVDANYNLGSVPVYMTTGSSVTIHNTNDTYEVKDGNGEIWNIRAQIKNDVLQDQDNNFIIRTAELYILGKKKNSAGTYSNITNQIKFGYKDVDFTSDSSSVNVMQKISKGQASDTIDGIKYPKTVNTYFMADSDGNVQPILGLLNSGTDDVYTNPVGAHIIAQGTDGSIGSYFYDAVNKEIYGETINLKSKHGYNYIDVDKYDKTDADAFKIGCGDMYTLGDGYVKRYNGKDKLFEKVYRVDRGLTNISATLPGNSAMLWNENNGSYSIIFPKPIADAKKDASVAPEATAVTTTGAAVSTVKTGWVKNTDGTWNFIKSDGIKATGWYQDGDTWYYLNTNGIMVTGWLNDNGIWYYCDESGRMLANTTIDGYVLNANGAWIN